MGTTKYLAEVKALFKKSPVVDFGSVVRIIEKRGGGQEYTKQLLGGLERKGIIKRLAKGKYTSLDDPSIAVLCFQPAYLGLQDALSRHGIWEQETIPVIVTARRVRPGIRKVVGINVLVRRLNKKLLFGFEYTKNGDNFLPVSDIEKTLIDMVYFKERISEETLGELRERVDSAKLKSYLAEYPESFRKRVLAKLSENIKK